MGVTRATCITPSHAAINSVLAAPDVGNQYRTIEIRVCRQATERQPGFGLTVDDANVDPGLIPRTRSRNISPFAAARVASVATATMHVAPRSRACARKPRPASR